VHSYLSFYSQVSDWFLDLSFHPIQGGLIRSYFQPITLYLAEYKRRLEATRTLRIFIRFSSHQVGTFHGPPPSAATKQLVFRKVLKATSILSLMYCSHSNQYRAIPGFLVIKYHLNHSKHYDMPILAPLIQARNSSPSSETNKGRDIGIIIACVIAIVILLYLM
jgi:hypothetical protein